MFRLPLLLALAACAAATTRTVSTPAELDAALAAAKPGDTILLRDGAWKDARIVLASAGTGRGDRQRGQACALRGGTRQDAPGAEASYGG